MSEKEESPKSIDDVSSRLRSFQSNKSHQNVEAFSVKEEDGVTKVWVSWKATLGQEAQDYLSQFDTKYQQLHQEFYFLNDELRPGSGLIRMFGGRPEGPGGTLTCLLSSKDGQDQYFVSAAHVLTNFWRETTLPNPVGSIYRYRAGYPATNSTFFLGKLAHVFPEKLPKSIEDDSGSYGEEADIGIVKIGNPDGMELKQRTTCYGSFGEWPPGTSPGVYLCQQVMKCGSQETHWTEAEVKEIGAVVPIYGPDGKRYRFSNQVILRDRRKVPSDMPPGEQGPEDRPAAKLEDVKRELYKPTYGERREEYPKKPCSQAAGLEVEPYPRNFDGTPFAVPGDSGTMVVDKDSKRPVGMLIAGSILNGLYVMTPFSTILGRIESKGLVNLRA